MFYLNVILYLFPVSSLSTFIDSLFYFSFQLTQILTIILWFAGGDATFPGRS